MSPVTHLLLGWAVANTARLEKRDRMLVTVAGLIPDVDGLGVVAEAWTRNSAHPLLWWTEYHHVIGHNLWFILLGATAATALARRKPATFTLCLISAHLHLLGDILGGRGPDGYVWTTPYLWPFSEALTLAWQGQWKLNSWQNLALTAALMGLALRWAWQRGYSPVELVSPRADRAVVQALRHRFPRPPGAAGGGRSELRFPAGEG